MKNKNKIFVISLLLLLICSLSAVAASENIAFDNSMNEKYGDETLNMDSEVGGNDVSFKNDNFKLDSTLNVNGTTFDDISQTIENASEGDTIFLEGKNYTGNGSAVMINKNITLIGGSSLNDGKYAILDARFLSNIITATAPVTIKGIIFINGNSTNGGAIQIYGDSTTVENCTFINNHANNYGGAVMLNGENSRISDCKFTNNSAEYGGALYINKDNCQVLNSLFINNHADNGGALATFTFNLLVSNCIFNDNVADLCGGALLYGGSNSTVYSCSFTNNTLSQKSPRPQGGGAIYSWGVNLKVMESTFAENKAETGSIILNTHNSSYFHDCVFIDNQAVINSLDILHRFYDGEYAIIEIIRICSDNPLLKGFATKENSNIEIIRGLCIEDGKSTTISSNIIPQIVQGDVVIYLNGTLIHTQEYVEDGIVVVPLKDIHPGFCQVSVVVKKESQSEIVSGDTFIPRINPEMKLIIPEIVAKGENVELKVILPTDAMGNVTVTMGGKKYYRTISSGQNVVIQVSNLDMGSYDVDVEYSGDNKYLPDWLNVNLDVSRIGISANNTHVIITVPKNTQGNIKVLADNQIIYNNNLAGNTLVIPYNMTPGQHNITVIIDNGGDSIIESRIVCFNKINPNMFVEIPEHVNKGNSVFVKVILPDDATGDVDIFDGEIMIESIAANGGTVVVPLHNLSGNHLITVKYYGDDKYESSSFKGSTTVAKFGIGCYIEVEKDFTRVSTDFNAGERGDYFYAVLKDEYGNPLVNKTVQIAVNGPIYTVKTDSQGRAAIMINLRVANTYTYALFFQGDLKYNASYSASAKLVVTKKDTYLKASNQTFKSTAKNKIVSATLSTVKNEFSGKMYMRSNLPVTLTINGKIYNARTDKNGKVQFNIGALTKKGTYNAVIKYAGDQGYEPVSKTIKIIIGETTSTSAATTTKSASTTRSLSTGKYSSTDNSTPTGNNIPTKKNTYIEVETDFTRAAIDYNAGERGAYFYAVLKDGNGNPLAGKNVQIAVNGPIYTVKTDSQGRAGLMVNLASANTYTYALAFSGDDEYNAAPLACSKLVVTKKPITITAKDQTFKATAKTKTVTATLSTAKNLFDKKIYLQAGKKVTLKVGGKTYTGTTNNAGKVTFNVQITKKGTYSATISFDSDRTYNSATKTMKIKIN